MEAYAAGLEALAERLLEKDEPSESGESWQGMEAQLIARLDSIAPKAPKTRGGEDRRLDLERGAGRRT